MSPIRHVGAATDVHALARRMAPSPVTSVPPDAASPCRLATDTSTNRPPPPKMLKLPRLSILTVLSSTYVTIRSIMLSS